LKLFWSYIGVLKSDFGDLKVEFDVFGHSGQTDILFDLILLEFDRSSIEFEDLSKSPIILSLRIYQNLFFS